MASIALRLQSPSSGHLLPSPNPTRLPTPAPSFVPAPGLHSRRRVPPPLSRCRGARSDSPSPSGEGTGGGGGGKRWDELIQGMVASAVKRWDDYVKSYRASQPQLDSEGLGSEAAGGSREEAGGGEAKEQERGSEWDWERWKRHFAEMEDQERIVSVLKTQLRDAVARENYADAAKYKLAISAAERNDTVGSALFDLSQAIKEERYKDAAFLRDYAGVGLVGWWAGVSEDLSDPYGRIIHISAEHGKYVAKSYSSRQLTSAKPGFPLFEIYFTTRDGQYKQQAVYLKRRSRSFSSQRSPKVTDVGSLDQSNSSSEEPSDVYADDINPNEEETDDDSDASDRLAGIQNVLRDMIPGAKVKVLKVVSPGKVDKDLIAKVIEQIMDEEDESTDDELESIEADDVRAESDIEVEEIESDVEDGPTDASEKKIDISVKVVIGPLMKEMSKDLPSADVIRVPAKLEKRDRFSFLFSIEQDEEQPNNNAKEQALQKRAAALSAQQSYNIMSDLAKVFTSKEKAPMKVLKDVGELISLTMNQNQNHQFLLRSTRFSRIKIPSTSDPLSGLYVGAHGMYTSEILHLKHTFGQWHDNDTKPTDLEFYEYVEAYKLTGSVSVPAGQVAFRAKVGKQYQLPHKGIIPEEFGVIARYKGQGRIADPGFRNPRWVDGELVILDGKYIRGGPVIGFVYWAPEYHFLVFFNRLKLPE